MIKRLTILFLVITTGIFTAGRVNAQIFDAVKKIKKEIKPKKSESTSTEELNTKQPIDANDSSENQIRTSKSDSKKISSSPNLIFSATPFGANDKVSKQTEFQFNQPIYGRVFLPYSYSDMFTDSELKEGKQFQIYVKAVEPNDDEDTITYASGFRNIYPHELKQKTFDFVFNPDAQAATNYPIQSDLGEVFRGMFADEKYAGKRVKMIVEITLLDQNGKNGEDVSSSFTIDYTKVNRKALLEAFDASEKNRKLALANADGFLGKQGTEKAKDLPLPKFFSMKEGSGYTGITKPQIIAMVKKGYNVTDVWNFRYEYTTEPEFFVVKNDLGVPLRMDSYRHFYFVWKNPDDGICRVNGGHLVKDYIGGGKYAPPRFVNSSFKPEAGENYPLDAGGNVIVDCAKAR